MIADGVLVPSVIGCVLFGTLLGLLAAVAGSELELRNDRRRVRHHPVGHERHHRTTRWVDRMPLVGSVVLVLFMGYTLYTIASAAIGRPKPSDQGTRVT
jgi:hypothetical protein